MTHKTPTAWKKAVVINKAAIGWQVIDPQATWCASIYGAPTKRECVKWVRGSDKYRLRQKNGA